MPKSTRWDQKVRKCGKWSVPTCTKSYQHLHGLSNGKNRFCGGGRGALPTARELWLPGDTSCSRRWRRWVVWSTKIFVFQQRKCGQRLRQNAAFSGGSHYRHAETENGLNNANDPNVYQSVPTGTKVYQILPTKVYFCFLKTKSSFLCKNIYLFTKSSFLYTNMQFLTKNSFLYKNVFVYEKLFFVFFDISINVPEKCVSWEVRQVCQKEK